jgi:hypothetical protein
MISARTPHMWPSLLEPAKVLRFLKVLHRGEICHSLRKQLRALTKATSRKAHKAFQMERLTMTSYSEAVLYDSFLANVSGRMTPIHDSRIDVFHDPSIIVLLSRT